jgi:hypothetical protein
LKPKDRNLAWISFASSRPSKVWFGVGSRGESWLYASGVTDAAAGTTAGVSAISAAGGGNEGTDENDAGSGGANVGVAAAIERSAIDSGSAVALGSDAIGLDPIGTK